MTAQQPTTGVGLYFHRLLCYFSSFDKAKAEVCFQHFEQFYLMFTSGSLFELFPDMIGETFRKSIRLPCSVKLRQNSIQYIAYTHMRCIWSLYEQYLPFLTHKNAEASMIPYMIGVVMDTLIGIVLNPKIRHFNDVYKFKCGIQDYKLCEKQTNTFFIWSENMVYSDRVEETMQFLWSDEINIYFGQQRTPFVNETQQYKTSSALLLSDKKLCEKGLPKRRSIRYIQKQMNRCIGALDQNIKNTAPCNFPCILIMIACNILGAYESSINIAHPNKRILLYSTTTIDGLFELCRKKINRIPKAVLKRNPKKKKDNVNNYLYNILAEFIIAWSSKAIVLSHLLQHMDFWNMHCSAVLWHCDYFMRLSRKTGSPKLAQYVPPKPFNVIPTRRNTIQSHERICPKNNIFYLMKKLKVAVKIPRKVFKQMALHEIDFKTIYKHAILNISMYGLDMDILNQLGIRKKTLRKMHAVVQSRTVKVFVKSTQTFKTKQVGSASKLIDGVLQCITNTKDTYILYLYLHALYQRSQFSYAPTFFKHTHAISNVVMVCMSCLSIRTRAYGESESTVNNNGFSIDLNTYKSYCGACDQDTIQPFDLSRHSLQVATPNEARGIHKVVTCTQCNNAAYVKATTIHGNSILCLSCAQQLQTQFYSHITATICGCYKNTYAGKKKRYTQTNFIQIVAINQYAQPQFYFICEDHARLIPQDTIFKAITLHMFFTNTTK